MVKRAQFVVLYRQFLFRAVDVELISAGGDMSKLLGQFGALLVWFSAGFGLAVMGGGASMLMVHFLIATTMLAVGVFAVLNWDSAFPDRRDVFVLAHLPVSSRTIFLAKVAATGGALAVTIAALNFAPGILVPAMSAPAKYGPLGVFFAWQVYRTLFAYWVTMFAAGVFVYGSLLTVQGMAAQIFPRRIFLRVSAVLQMAAFCAMVAGYFLEPSWALKYGVDHLPAFWFQGLFETLNGSHLAVMHAFAERAVENAAIALAAAGCAYALSYFRTLRKMVEEPDILPGRHSLAWLPRFGSGHATAVVQFAIRTLARSRQHRMILAFYLGIGFAVMILLGRTPEFEKRMMADAAANPDVAIPLLAASVVMMVSWIAGTRVVFSMPMELRANWIYRVMPPAHPTAGLRARRRAGLVLALAPVWLLWAAGFLAMWPPRPAIAHLTLLALAGVLLVEVLIAGGSRIPFTCSYLPGKSQLHLAFLGAMGLGYLILKAVEWEARIFANGRVYGLTVAAFAGAIFAARWWNQRGSKDEDAGTRFEDLPDPAVLELKLSG